MNFVSSEKFFINLNKLSGFEYEAMIENFCDFDLVADKVRNLGDDINIIQLTEIFGSRLPIEEDEFDRKFDKMIQLENDQFMNPYEWEGHRDYWVYPVVSDWMERIVDHLGNRPLDTARHTS